MRILIADDDDPLLEQLQTVLETQRYLVETAKNGQEALDRIFQNPFDAVILDIMMPTIDGLTVLKEMRKAGDKTPVLMLTAKGDVEDKVRGLDLGADDYLAKPFSLDELLARIRSLLRRGSENLESIIRIHDLKLDTVTRSVTVKGQSVDLTPREFSILEFLLYNKNRAVSRFSLAEHIWGDDFDPFSMSNFMDVHIKNLRQKLKSSDHENIITTLRGVGYIIQDTKQ